MFASVHSVDELNWREVYRNMEANVLFLVGRLNQMLEQQGRTQIAKKYGLTATQILVLSRLQRQGKGVCATDLHQQLGMSKAALSAAIRDLSGSGYLQVTSFPGDCRRKEIHPTAKAMSLHRQIQKELVGLERQACCGLSNDQVELVRQSLDKMMQNLSRCGTAA